MSYVKVLQPTMAYDAGSWHATCLNVQLVMNNATGVPWLWCPDCRCTAQLDLVADPITHESSRRPRREVTE